jgi:hypothetical protein
MPRLIAVVTCHRSYSSQRVSAFWRLAPQLGAGLGVQRVHVAVVGADIATPFATLSAENLGLINAESDLVEL